MKKYVGHLLLTFFCVLLLYVAIKNKIGNITTDKVFPTETPTRIISNLPSTQDPGSKDQPTGFQPNNSPVQIFTDNRFTFNSDNVLTNYFYICDKGVSHKYHKVTFFSDPSNNISPYCTISPQISFPSDNNRFFTFGDLKEIKSISITVNVKSNDFEDNSGNDSSPLAGFAYKCNPKETAPLHGFWISTTGLYPEINNSFGPAIWTWDADYSDIPKTITLDFDTKTLSLAYGDNQFTKPSENLQFPCNKPESPIFGIYYSQEDTISAEFSFFQIKGR